MRAIEELGNTVRSLIRAPRHLVLTTGCLALGLGANVAMFGVVDALFVRQPALVGHPETVTRVYFDRHVPVRGAIVTELSSFLILKDLQGSTSSFTNLAGYYSTIVSEGRGTAAAKLRAVLASGNYFDLLETRAAFGRTIDTSDAKSAAPVAVISDALWQTHFGSDRSIVGKTLTIAERQYSIIGVMPRGFVGADLEPADLWLPLETAAGDLILPNYLTIRGALAISLLGRLKPDVAMSAASADVTRAFRNSMRSISTFDSTDRAIVAPVLRERGPKRSDQARVSVWLGGLSVAVLLITCLNCATLVLLRGMRRRPELTLRSALGATSGQLVRLLAIENAVIATFAAVVSIAIASITLTVFRSLLLPPDAGAHAISLTRLFGYTAVVALVTGALLSLPVMAMAWRKELYGTLKASERAISGFGGFTREGLIAAQIALTVVLLVGAGLFATSLKNVRTLDLGFQSGGVLAANLDFTGITPRPHSVGSSEVLFDQIEQAVGALPGVRAVAVSSSVPFQNQTVVPLTIPGRDTAGLKPTASLIVASEGYARTLRLKVVAGRWFDRSDYGVSTTTVVNETFAKKFWPGESAIGKCVVAGEPPCRQIIGMVADTRRSELTENPREQIYFPGVHNAAVSARLQRTLLVLADNPVGLAPSVRRAIQSVGTSLPYVSIRPLDDLIAPKTQPWKLGTMVFFAFGGLALLVATIGLYGAMSSSVAQRRAEFAIRLALGASSSHVASLVLVRAGTAVAVGCAVGLVGAWLGGPAIQSVLFGADAKSLPVFIVAAATMIVAGFLSCVSPIRAARRVNVVDVLRGD